MLLAGFLPGRALAEEPPQGDVKPATEAPKEAEPPAPVLPAAPTVAPAAPAAPVAPAAAPAAPAVAPPRPKFGDVSTSGYFRGSFGATIPETIPGQGGMPDMKVGGRMTCFQLALPGNLHAKYRLGNECEVWAETHFTVVTYVGDDGSVARLHFMPTVYIPYDIVGYPPTDVINSPLQFSTSTGATLSFPNLYADLTGVHWLYGGTVWAGARYYKRESVYINDFFYWNPSGVGAGIEDAFRIGTIWPFAPAALRDVAFSEAVFAVDGEPGLPGGANSPPVPMQSDFGLRSDFQIRGFRPWWGAELQLGFQRIVNLSNDPATAGGSGYTLQYVQNVVIGVNKLAVQYGQGGGTGFGTLARFYYPDFSLRHDPNEFRLRGVEVLTVQPAPWLGAQLDGVIQHDDLNTGTSGQSTWYSLGGRVSWALVKHLKLQGEAGLDHVQKANGAPAQWLAKFTGALSFTADRGFWARPEVNLFYTWARWDEAARTATIDSGMIYTASGFLSGAIAGIQAETWW